MMVAASGNLEFGKTLGEGTAVGAISLIRRVFQCDPWVVYLAHRPVRSTIVARPCWWRKPHCWRRPKDSANDFDNSRRLPSPRPRLLRRSALAWRCFSRLIPPGCF